MSREAVFTLFFLGFAAVLVYAGWITRKWIADSSDFILAGREVSLLMNIFGVAAIGYAGTSIALAPGFAVTYGFWGSMAWSGIYSLGGLALFGLLFTTFIRRCGAQTLPEWLEMRFSPSVRLVVTVTTVLGLTGIMANNIVSLGGVIAGYVGWPPYLANSLCFLIVLAFSYFSGLWAVTLTDFIQMILGLVAIPTFVLCLIAKYGGLSWLLDNWTGPNIWSAGFKGAKLPIMSLTYPSVFTFIVLFAAFLVWGNNYYWLRAASCRSERVAKWSFFWAGVLLVVVIYIPLAFVGLYAAAVYPNAFAPVGKVAPTAAYGLLLKDLSPALSSFLLVGALAASISTAATAFVGATSTAVRDIYQRVFKPDATPKDLLLPTKVILVIMGVITWLLCLYPGGPTYLFAFANAWLGPPSILVLLGLLWPRFTAAGALSGAVLGMGTMAIFTLLELTKTYVISNVMHVGIAGLIATLVPGVVVSLCTRPKYYGEPGWSVDPEKRKPQEVKLEPVDLEVLDMIRHGHESMAEITDALKVDSRLSNAVIERLDLGGYIRRKSLIGAGFYSFELTPRGEQILPALKGRDAEMARDGLKPEYLEVLKAAKGGSQQILDIAARMGSLKQSCGDL